MTKFVSRVRRRLSGFPFLPVAYGIWRTAREWGPSLLARNWKARRSASVPIPPGRLIFSATATRDVSWFLRSGKMGADSFRSALLELNRPIETFRAVLDMGCGCGRVLRHWNGIVGPRFFGTDYNLEAVNWTRQNLPAMKVSTNQLAPPLPYADKAFDLVYAVSVFTHLPDNLQRAWIQEMHRVLEPGGILILTLSGESELDRLTPSERTRFRNGELVVLDPQYAGTNICAVYHPESFVRRNWSDLFRVRKIYPEGAMGSPRQDLYVFEKLD